MKICPYKYIAHKSQALNKLAPDPEVIKPLSNSAQLRLKFILLKNVGILTYD